MKKIFPVALAILVLSVAIAAAFHHHPAEAHDTVPCARCALHQQIGQAALPPAPTPPVVRQTFALVLTAPGLLPAQPIPTGKTAQAPPALA